MLNIIAFPFLRVVGYGRTYRRNHHTVSKKILSLSCVGKVILREFIVQWMYNANACFISNPSCSVYIGEKFVSEENGISHYFEIVKWVHPNSSLNNILQLVFFSAMSTKNGTEDSELKPSAEHLTPKSLILLRESMSSYIIAPVSIANIRSCCCEVWLKFQGIPANESISSKTDWIAMVPKSTIQMKDYGTLLIFALHICIMEVVEIKCGIHAWN